MRSLLVLAGLPAGACDGGSVADPGATAQVAIAVAPLQLEGVTNARYTLTVRNGAGGSGEVVWARTIDSNGYGDGAGSLSYVGPCDASTGTNTVTLDLDALYEGSGVLVDEATYRNPTPVSRDITCVANADAAVTFDMTIARQAQQGFFDVAINFNDIFCSAKVDCGPPGEPLTLVFDPDTNARVPTVVSAFACTDGDPAAGAATHLYRDDVVIRCGGVSYSVSASAGPGNVYAARADAPAPIVQAMVFEGKESLLVAGVDADKVYWNVALGLDAEFFASLDAGTTCTLETLLGASAGPLSEGRTPADAIYPYVEVSVPLFTGSTRVCTQHPLDGAAPNDGVATAYTVLPGATGRDAVAFAHVLSQAPGGVSSAPVVPAAWSTPLVPTVAEFRGAPGVNVGLGFSTAGMLGGTVVWATGNKLWTMDAAGAVTDWGATATTVEGSAISAFQKVWGDPSGSVLYASVDLNVAGVASRGLISSTDGQSWSEVRVVPVASQLYIELAPCGEHASAVAPAAPSARIVTPASRRTLDHSTPRRRCPGVALQTTRCSRCRRSLFGCFPLPSSP